MFADRASQLEQQNPPELNSAADYLHRYLRLRPEDSAARIRLAQVFDKTASTPAAKYRSVELHYRAINASEADATETLELGKRLTELLLELQKFSEAEKQAEKLLNTEFSAEAQRFIAMAKYGQYQTQPGWRSAGLSVADSMENAIAVNPDDVELPIALAELVRRFDQRAFSAAQRARPEYATEAQRAIEADRLVDQAVSNNGDNAEAYLARYFYRQKFDREINVESDLRSAIEFGKDNLEVRLAAGDYYLRKAVSSDNADDRDSQLAMATEHYQYILKEIDPATELAHVGMGSVHAAEGDLPSAIEVWREGKKLVEPESLLLSARLTESLIQTGQLGEAETELQQLEQIVKQRSPQLNQRGKLAIERSYDFLRASLLTQQGNINVAVPLLIRITQSAIAGPGDDIQYKSLMLLGTAYLDLQKWDLAAITFEEAIKLDSNDPAPQLAAARALSIAQRPSAAIAHCDRAIELARTSDALAMRAQLELQYQSQLPSADQDWLVIEQTVDELKSRIDELTQPWRVEILAASLLIAKSRGNTNPRDLQGTVNDLKSAEQKYEDVDFLRALVFAFEEAGNSEEADRVLKKYTQASDDEVEASLAKAGLFIQRRQYDAAKAIYDESLSSLTGQRRAAILQRLSELTEVGDHASVGKLQELHEAHPDDVNILLKLAEAAIDAGDVEAAQRWENKLLAAEGAGGSLWRYCKVRRLLIAANDVNDEKFREAAAEYVRIETQRPAWPNTHLLRGLIAERRESFDEAVKAYRRAIDLGDRRVAVHSQLFRLLYHLKRFDEANKVSEQLGLSVSVSPSLSQLALSTAVSSGDIDRAQTIATKSLQQRPDDLMAHIWQGQVLLLANKPEDAELALRRAAYEVSPDDIRPWQALFIFYIRTQQPEKARETLDQAATEVKFEVSGEKEFLLAQGLETLGQNDEAKKYYLQAIKSAPGRSAIHFRFARFQMAQNDRDGAEQSLRRGLKLEPHNGAAVRGLATILALRGTPEDWEEVDSLLTKHSVGNTDGNLDRRLMAILFARRGQVAYLARAREILEELTKDSKESVDGDRLLLAEVYIRESRFPSTNPTLRSKKLEQADKLYLELIRRENPDNLHVRMYIDFLLDHGRAGDAQPLLESLRSDTFAGVLLEARWLSDQGKRSELKALIEAFAEKQWNAKNTDQQRVAVCRSLGSLYAQYDFAEDAEKWFRKLMELDPQGYVAMAQFLAQQKRINEAIELCKSHAETDQSGLPAVVLASILTSPGVQSDMIDESSSFLFEAVQKYGTRNPNLLLAIANMRAANKQNEEAIAIYRQVLKMRPNDGMAMNNLATMLAENPSQRNEALIWIDKAIETLGPRPELYDTKGMVLVYLGRVEEGIPLLEYTLTSDNVDPRYHFHLAVAYFQTGQFEKAREQLAKANELKLEQQILTAEDQKMLEKLKNGLDAGQTSPT